MHRKLRPGSGLNFDLYFPPPAAERRKNKPAMTYNSTFIRVFCDHMPWVIDIPGQDAAPVTYFEVLTGLYDAMQHELTDSDWLYADDRRRDRIRKFWERRKTSGESENNNPLRIDWLGKRTRFAGLTKVPSEEISQLDLLPRDQDCSEVWNLALEIVEDETHEE